eukprot:CAMPEP_0172668828 /NCGR_PEP_ID=MMETSP1074-20121228/9303_1 /TAXON_ID=2916 /ORGANISM="Ceratium fusus, Strain PA161109" /LENGTH=50 /DNA_ID=CAMNT_0013485523 /DNA_START=285 /DNA_END=437 /DNA_ORIENTATION=-
MACHFLVRVEGVNDQAHQLQKGSNEGEVFDFFDPLYDAIQLEVRSYRLAE